MVNYLPENIYNKIKDSEQYKKIDEKVNKIKYSAKDMAEFSVNDYKIKKRVSLDSLFEIIMDRCTEDELNMLKMMHADNREEIESTKVESFTAQMYKLALLISFFDEDYKQLIDEYIDKYKSKNKDECVEIVHVEYFLFATRKVIYTTNWSEDALYNMLNEMNEVYAEVSDYVSEDTLNTLYTTEFCRALERISDIAPTPKDAFETTKGIAHYPWQIMDYQYKGYDFGAFAVIDRLFDIAFFAREFEVAADLMDELIDMINHALDDRQMLMRGLNFYNKDWSFSFLIMLYKWKRILALLPSYNKSFNLTHAENFATNQGINITLKLSKLYRVDMEKVELVEESEVRAKKAIDDVIDANIENFRIFNFVIGG